MRAAFAIPALLSSSSSSSSLLLLLAASCRNLVDWFRCCCCGDVAPPPPLRRLRGFARDATLPFHAGGAVGSSPPSSAGSSGNGAGTWSGVMNCASGFAAAAFARGRSAGSRMALRVRRICAWELSDLITDEFIR